MSKKKNARPAKTGTGKKVLIGLAIVLAIAAVSIGIALWQARDEGGDPSGWIPGDSTTRYNTAATEKAWSSRLIAEDEILVQETIEKNLGGDTKMTFHIYKLPEGADPKDYLHLEVADLPEDTPLVHMGTASCRFLGDKLTSIYGLTIKYIR